jgi:nucleoside-diphosphate-sugar epimerase
MRKVDKYFATTNRLRTEGTANLLAAAEQIGGARVIAQSYGASIYPPDGPLAKPESAGIDPNPPKVMASVFASIQRLEALVTTASPNNVALRYGGFYGPGTSVDVDSPQVRAIRKGWVPVIGDGGGAPSYLHVTDAATGTVAALNHPEAGGVYNIVDDEPALMRDWLPFVAEVLGARRPRRVPAWVGWLLTGDAGIYLFTKARGGSNAKAKAELGWQPTYPDWRAGFRAALGG